MILLKKDYAGLLYKDVGEK